MKAETKEKVKDWFNDHSSQWDCSCGKPCYNYNELSDHVLSGECNRSGILVPSDEQINIHILQHFHGFSPEQWAELKNEFPYAEIESIVRRAIYKYAIHNQRKES